ncbi:hypothetical protein CJU90_1813 [Yarrowia sp. C11]|nr:hypothetical protein CJU90_1813 [Yarrowia sp. C11]
MFATLSTNQGLDLGQLSGLLAQESTQGGSSPTSVVVAASPTADAPSNNDNTDGGLGPSQSIIDNGPGFQSSLQALLGTSVTLDVPSAGSNTGNASPQASGDSSPAATITASPTEGGSDGSNTGPGFTLPTFPAVTLSDSPSAPENTGSGSGGGFLGNIFDGIFGTNSIAIPQSWSELFVKTVDWNTLYNGSPGTIDSSGNIIPMPTATDNQPAPVVTGSVITLVASPLPTSEGSSSGGGILGWIGGLFGGDSSTQAPVATAPVVTASSDVTVVTGTAVVTLTSCSDSPCSVAPSPSTILPPTLPETTGPTQANGADNLKIVVPLLAVPLLALL